MPETVQVFTQNKEYDALWLRIRLSYLGFKPCIPYRAIGYEKRPYQKPPKPAENEAVYKERYKGERAFSWFGGFKRLSTRYERKGYLYKALWQLGAAMIIFQHIMG